ncbi:acylneuraminate cytidylyltransferase family protein [Bacillus carboniphilus]|uniref:Acylneuraminate cytidylyltransferase family protein n=1 Tax=Bacillus carboniphilus TaxID=86663 RepID=A0ABY9JTG3_9BACI|nr:acylneuraminate cytidylyltransferase family protein [Bacillus carboniphilus]WLR41583.1 acylneuraminate cytidylyltransferase family protein [Bacillus carboniphilus]
MYNNKKFLAIIPARGGSKGIPRKNLADVKGAPLISYSIEEALKSKYLDSVIVSTEDQEIAEVSTQLGAEIPFLRPNEFASDTAKTIEVLVYTVNKLEESGRNYDYLVLLQPTQPLRKSWHIDEAIEQIVNSSYSDLVSVSKVDDHPILVRKISDDGSVINLLDVNSSVRRQDFPDFYKVNGAIYINKIDDQFGLQSSLNDNKLAYIMSKEYDLDIDEPLDLEILKLMIK